MATDTPTPETPTPETPPAPETPEAPTGDASALGWGLLWGAGMLVVLALWLRAKFEELSFALIGLVGLLGAAGVALGVWILITALRGKSTAETAAKQRNLAGLACLAGGGIMLLVAVALWFFLGLGGFGEFVGLALFGMVAIVTGRNLLRTEPASTDDFWQRFRANLGTWKMVLFALGAAQLLAFGILVFGRKLDAAWFPELAALLVGGFFYLGAGFWLALRSLSVVPLSLCRVFALIVGGVTGFIVTIMILARMFLWRDQVFLGGLDVWLGEGSWRLWLCAYVLLLGLALMFGSLLLARTDVRENVGLRRTLYGYSTILNGVLILAVLILFNILFYILVPYTFAWSRSGFSALSPSSKNLLQELTKDTHVLVFMTEGHRAYGDLKNLLDNARAHSSKLHVEYVSPDRNRERYLELAERFPVLQAERAPLMREERGLLIVYGDLPQDPGATPPPHAYLPANKIMDIGGGDPHAGMRGAKQTQVFKAEAEMMRELNSLRLGKQKRKLYVLQGNAEADLGSQEAQPRQQQNRPLSEFGLARLAERLKKEEYDLEGLTFSARLRKDDKIVSAPEVDKKKSIPEDAYAVLIAGPSESLPQEALDALERYVDRGGRLLVFFDTVADAKYAKIKTTGLEEFLKKYNVEVKNDFAVVFPERIPDPRLVIVRPPDRPETLLAKQFARKLATFVSVRVVRPSAGPGRYKADVLLQLNDKELDFWTETDPFVLGSPLQYLKELKLTRAQLAKKVLYEPLPIAVTVTDGAGDNAKPRMVVFGDADMLLNDVQTPGPPINDYYFDLVAGSLEWMSERPVFIGPRPRETPVYNVPKDVEPRQLLVVPSLLMILSTIGLGAGLWLVRRR